MLSFHFFLVILNLRFPSLSSYQPSIWLDDLYVEKEQRSQGVGAILMNQLAQIAKENNCTHLAWNADAQNTRGLSFYHRLGAKITEQHGNRCFLRWVPWSDA
jgi:GNAT superfamily N-acetyltransferase